MSSLTKLEKLADSNEGPLRIEYEKGIPYLGIRTWKTFFFEKLVLDDLDIPDIERNTAETIDSFVGGLVEAIKKSPKKPSALGTMENSPTPDLGVLSSSILFKLQAKASGTDLKPRVSTTAWINASTSGPAYRDEKVDLTTVGSFNGKFIVPKGLSIGTVPIWKVMAEARLLSSSFMSIEDSSGQSRFLSPNSKQKKDPSEFEENDYFIFYKLHLERQVKASETSVAIQLVFDIGGGSSEDNQNGAWRAADEFVKKRAAKQQPVSVLLCTANLPKIKKNPELASPRFQRTQPSFAEDSDSDYIV